MLYPKPPSKITASTPVTTLVADTFRVDATYDNWRPRGCPDWLLILTVGGAGWVGTDETGLDSRPGVVTLYTPHTPQRYCTDPDFGHWHLLWSHFHPLPHWDVWMQWPESAPGLRSLALKWASPRSATWKNSGCSEAPNSCARPHFGSRKSPTKPATRPPSILPPVSAKNSANPPPSIAADSNKELSNVLVQSLMETPVNTASLIAADKAHIWHPFTQMKDWCAPDHHPLVLVAGKGATLRDSEGREYIDGNSSIWTNIHGHRHPAINAAITAQLDQVAHVSFLGTTNIPAITLAERLTAFFPADTLSRVFYSDDGSTAMEVAVKMTIQYWQLVGQPRRTRFVAFDNAYHGDTAGAASLGGVSTFTDRFAPVHFPIQRVADLAALETLSGDPEEIAAIVIEPIVQGVAGICPWPPGMLKKLRAWCDSHGILLIFDEVLTGFGRTGKMFACHQENVFPDFLCLAKGLTGGYIPLAATLTTERIYEAFLGEYTDRKTFFYGHSYCANPVGCAAALASLSVFESENTLANLQPKIVLLHELLAPLLDSPHVAAIRQCGFISGVEVQKAPGIPYPWEAQTGNRVCLAARQHGLLTRPILDTIALIPPLCISADELRRAVKAVRLAIAEVCEVN